MEKIIKKIEKRIINKEESIKEIWKDFKGDNYFFKSQREERINAEIKGLIEAIRIIRESMKDGI